MRQKQSENCTKYIVQRVLSVNEPKETIETTGASLSDFIAMKFSRFILIILISGKNIHKYTHA